MKITKVTNHLFFRVYLILVPLVFFTLLAVGFFVDNTLEADDGAFFKRDAIIEAELLLNQLDGRPPSDWQQIVQAYSPRLDTKVHLITANQFEDLDVRYDSTVPVTVHTDPFSVWWITLPMSDGHHYLLVEEWQSEVTSEELIEALSPLIAATMVVGIFMLVVSRSLGRPIKQLVEAIRALGDGKMVSRVPIAKREPLRTLTHYFNQMADNISSLIETQRVITGALPHELRTPLAKVRFALDLTRDVTDMTEMRNQLELVDQHLEELSLSIEDTLVLIKLGASSKVIPTETVNATLEDMRQYFIENNKNMSITWQSSVDSLVNDSLLRIAISNLVRNAIRYGRTTVCVRAEESAGWVQVVIEDDGQGIPPAERCAVFQAFYRVNESRSRESGGIGLGLAIVRAVADRLQGDVFIEDSLLGGAAFILRWPVMEVID